MYTVNPKINNQLSLWLISMFWIVSIMIVVGGLTSIVKILAYENKYYGNIKSFALQDKFINNYGSQDDLLESHGLGDKKIINSIIKFVKKNE